MSVKSRTSAAKRALLEELTVTVEDAALLLGMSRNGTYDAIKENQIPHIRIGRCIRVPSAALRSLLKVETTNA
jgi:excisionase family DNA binding protein